MKPPRFETPIAHYTPGDAWRECPRCHGVKILAGAPVLKADAELVEFHLVRIKCAPSTMVACSRCGFEVAAQ